MPTYLFGTLGNRTVDLRRVCHGGLAREVSVLPTAESAVLGLVTLGVYIPLEVRVRCNDANDETSTPLPR